MQCQLTKEQALSMTKEIVNGEVQEPEPEEDYVIISKHKNSRQETPSIGRHPIVWVSVCAVVQFFPLLVQSI